ncbi:hypothetical protein [Frankia sp. QA3]|uniref:hypothetical protein n=1 Tax=Frankia sp. QA3 TaxID=710111 RepID=UPI000269D034|nr:hypothetical protein [Frankia sp. QA3]EIV95218.1 hypothetical protein FraQA3DRAFT_5026 [Frankia sp. QA3]
MPQSSGSSPGRGSDHGSTGPTGHSGPPPVRRATSESINIPPARTPPDDHPEDYPPEPPTQPPIDRCDLGPISAPSAQQLWAADDLADLARSSVLFGQEPFGPAGPVRSGWSPGGPYPSCAAPSTHSLMMFGAPAAFTPTAAGPAPADAVAPAPRPAAPGVSDRRQFHRYAGAAMMTAILAEGQIMEVSDVLAASPIQLALERADDMLGDLLDAHEATPPAHIFAQTARLRRGLERLGRRSMPAGDARRRDMLTGRVAVLGADAAFKLGDIETARSLTTLGFQAGGLAGEGPLRGSAREVAAVNEFYAGRPDEALRLARDGLTHVGDGPVRARLICQVARALAALGDVRGAAQALDQAYDLADLIPPDQWGRPGPSFENFNPVEVSYNATTALCLLGRPQAAQEHAELAMPKLDAMNAPGFRSVIRLDLALALARQGRLELERVCDLATEAIQISWGRTVASVSGRADQLLSATRPHSEVREVRELALLVREWQRSAAGQRPGPGAITAPGLTV